MYGRQLVQPGNKIVRTTTNINMAYTHFKYIAYQTPTMYYSAMRSLRPAINVGNRLVAEVNELQGNVDGLTTDSRQRVLRMIRAIKRAETRIRVNDNDNTLKIFMAPEFYFRPTVDTSTTGEVAYSYDEYKSIKDVLRKTIGADEQRFRHWLIIPGTILWKLTGRRHLIRNNLAGNEVYLNSSLYIFFDDNGNIKSHAIEKIKASEIDGLPTGRHATRAGPGDAAKKKTGEEQWGSYASKSMKRKHFFNCRGISCAVEICLEHTMYSREPGDGGLVKETLQNWQEGVCCCGGQPKVIDLQLLTGGGSPISERSVATRTGGYILRTDGVKSTFPPYQTNLCQVLDYMNNGVRTSFNKRPGSAILEPAANAGNPPGMEDVFAFNDININQPVDCPDDDWFDPSLKIYERKTI